MSDDSILYDFVFHFNPYKGKWRAVHREHYNELFSGGKNILESSSERTLKAIIIKTNGNFEEADKLLTNHE